MQVWYENVNNLQEHESCYRNVCRRRCCWARLSVRLEVQDNEVRLLADGTEIAHADSNGTDTLSNGPLTFNSTLTILRIVAL